MAQSSKLWIRRRLLHISTEVRSSAQAVMSWAHHGSAPGSRLVSICARLGAQPRLGSRLDMANFSLAPDSALGARLGLWLEARLSLARLDLARDHRIRAHCPDRNSGLVSAWLRARLGRLGSVLDARGPFWSASAHLDSGIGSGLGLGLSRGSIWLILVWLQTRFSGLGSAYDSEARLSLARLDLARDHRIRAHCPDRNSGLVSAWLRARLGRLGSVLDARGPFWSASAHLDSGISSARGLVSAWLEAWLCLARGSAWHRSVLVS